MKKKLANDTKSYLLNITLFRRIKQISLLYFLLLSFLMPMKGYAQGGKINLSLNNSTLKEALKLIEQQTAYVFFYNESEIDVSQKVTVSVVGGNIEQALNALLTTYQYKIDNRKIAIFPGNKAEGKSKAISGTVTDDTDLPVVGANIVVEGTLNGTITDIDGRFSLAAPVNSVLRVSYIGYVDQYIPINNQTNLRIKLREDNQALEEVIVVGYGTQKKKDLTGAVSHINMEGMQELPNTNLTQALRGTIAGVNVNTDGKPGSSGNIVIRGLTSISAGNSPLIIVDGIPLAGSLNDINSADIESIDVLKDGSAAAVYGAKSSNGVILVTTKRGKSEKPVIQYNGYAGFQKFSRKLKMLEGPAYVKKIVDYARSNGVENPDPATYMQDLEYQNYLNDRTVDPIDFVSQSAPVHSHDISVSGKNNRTTYYLSGSFTSQKGLIYNDNFQRVSLRANIENKITDWFSVGVNAAFGNRDDSGLAGNIEDAVTLSPYSQMFDEEGNMRLKVHGGGEAMATNPIFWSSRTKDTEKTQNLTANLYAQIDVPFVKGLSYRLNYSNTYNWYKHFVYTPSYEKEMEKNIAKASKEYNENYNWLVENIIKYQKHFLNVHDIDVTLLFSRDHYQNDYSKLSNSDFFSDILGYNKLEAGKTPAVASSAKESDGLSYMGRLNYRLMDRYLITLLARRDGYSAFGKEKKWGTFPSIAIGWIISEEAFMKKINWLTNLKIRYSYSETGNQAIAPYSSLAQMSQNQYVFGDGSSPYNGIYNSAMGNKDLTWETTKSSNIGIDFGVFGSRLSGSLEYYDLKTKDLLMKRAIPSMTGYNSVYTNLGGISNKGFELTLNSVNISNKDFEWSTVFTLSTNKNKITSLYGLDQDKDGKEDDDIGNGWFIGQPIGAVYDYTLNGIYQEGENIPSGFKPGYYRLVDKNNTGSADPGDRSIIGKTSPDIRMGLGNTFAYKGFTLYFFINSSFGGKKSNPMLNPAGWFPDRLNILDIGEAYWTPENKSNTRPTIGYAMPFTHGFYESLSYVRIQDVSFSYDIPKRLLEKAKINNLRIYVAAKNLATFTNWSGWDPEIDANGTASEIKKGGYPLAKTFTFGLNFSF